MTSVSRRMVLRHLHSMLLFAAAVLTVITAPALAGQVYFEIQSSENTLRLTAKSRENLYFPRVHIMDHAGNWLPALALEGSTQVEPDSSLITPLTPAIRGRWHRSMALRVSFSDKAGFRHIQFGTAKPWPVTAHPAHVDKSDNGLWIGIPEAAVSSTWALVPHGEDRDSSQPFSEASPAPAVQLVWSERPLGPKSVSLGAGGGPTLLLHEGTAQAADVFSLQHVADLHGASKLSPFWLSGTLSWVTLSLFSLALGVLLAMAKRPTADLDQQPARPHGDPR